MRKCLKALRKRADLLICLVFLLLWSSGFSIVKVGLNYSSPLLFLWLRYVLVVLVLLPLVFLQKPPLPKGRQWLGLIAIGMLMQCVYFAGTYLAISAGISAGLLALIVSMQPVLIGVASPLLRTPLARPQWMGMLLGFAGAAVVILSKSQVERFTALGMGLAWLSLLGLCGAVLLEKTLEPQPVLVSLAVQYVFGLVVVAPLVLSLETTHLVWTWPLLGALGYLALCNSLLAVALLMLMIRRNEAAKVSAVFFLVPPCAALFALVLLNEPMPALAWAGVVLAAAGVRLCTKPTDVQPQERAG
ncbi:DMT family transporter [Xanthomonas campestris pv. campestris]|uniref:DMT family transporter n=1 Tax=Xanthomonas campestris TaxID=339 RepID=UPI00226AF57C|nr:DMT family transporter [Xanthomonas campestris]MEB1349016.1 DMT family transporter [Xanthomonas campestris pv. campestris]